MYANASIFLFQLSYSTTLDKNFLRFILPLSAYFKALLEVWFGEQ